VKGCFFLRKKQLSRSRSLYTNWRTAIGGRSEARARTKLGGLTPARSVPVCLDAGNGINAAKSGLTRARQLRSERTTEMEGRSGATSPLQPAQGAVQIELPLRQNGQFGMVAAPLSLRNLRP
jgi:hypothetical protein